jgi:hypothetical protein
MTDDSLLRDLLIERLRHSRTVFGSSAKVEGGQ